MIIEYVRYSLDRHQPEELIEAYTRAARHLAAAPECLNYELSQCVEDPRHFVVRIMWTSRGDHLNAFRRSSLGQLFIQEVRAFIGEIVEMRHYEARDQRS